MSASRSLASRGAADNPPNRFESLVVEPDPALDPDEQPAPRTELLVDPSRRIVATNESPDVGFDASVNPYRGCEHGCVYCYARPTHEYLGLSAGLDFETRILVKPRAPELLRRSLASRHWTPQVVALSGVTDPYQPAEARLGITRGCLEVLAEFRNPVAIVTKSRLVTRDVDLLSELARHDAAAVMVSLTTLDRELQRRMEPRATVPHKRVEAIARLADAGVPVGFMMGPVIPGLTDHEIPDVVAAAAGAGARFGGHILLRLPHGVAELFEQWLARHFPERKARVMARIREVRGGRRNDPRFGHRQRGEGVYADHIHRLFELACTRHGLGDERPTLSAAAFRRDPAEQLGLFSGRGAT